MRRISKEWGHRVSNVLTILAIGFAIFQAWNMGVNHGLATAPELVQYKKDSDAEYEAFMIEMSAAPTGREAVCDQVFEMVWDRMILEEGHE